jgi:hypothetical protein
MRGVGVGTAVCALILAAGSGGATGAATAQSLPKAGVLYSQNADPQGAGLISTVFPDGYNDWTSTGADDFAVPAGQTWSVQDVDVTGKYAARKGPAPQSVNVVFYADGGGTPGDPLASYQLAVKAKNGPSYQLALGTAETLAAGTYWVSVQPVGIHVQGSDEHKFWIWESTTDAVGATADWENPQNGFHLHCRTWTAVTQCASDQVGPGFMFALRGTAS